MTSVWTLVLSQLGRKKLQNLLTALMILLSTLLIATSIMVMTGTKNLFHDMHGKSNGSHQLLLLEQGLHDPEWISNWWDERAGVQSSGLLPYGIMSKVVHNGESLPNVYVYMMRSPQQESPVDRLLLAQGARGGQPEQGTIWLPTSLAYSNGIEAGDTLRFEGSSGFELQVGAIVVDMPYGAPFSTSSRIWMNPDDYDRWVAADSRTERYMLALRYDDYAMAERHFEQFEAALGSPYLETRTGFEEISAFYLIMSRVIGFIMIVLGAIMMAIALFTISFTISDAILAEYRTIGILKSVGLTSAKIIGAYLGQYALLSVIAVLPGLALSGFVSRLVMAGTLSYLQTGETTSAIPSVPVIAATGTAVILLVLGCVWLAARSARFIMPAQAIRYGMSEKSGSRQANPSGLLSRLSFARFPAIIVVGGRSLLRNRAGSLLVAIIAAVSSAALVLGFVVITSIASIKQTAAEWGYDQADIAVIMIQPSEAPRDDLERAVLADPQVQAVGWGASMTGVIDADPAMNIYISVLDGSYDDIGFAVLEGRNPRSRNETAIGANVARSLDKNVGDTIAVYMQGEKQTLLISGIYQAIANMSYSARITAEALPQAGAGHILYDIGYIVLQDAYQADEVASELNDRFREMISAITQQELLDSVFNEAVSLLLLPMSFIGLLFLGIAAIIVYSTCRIQIRKDSKTYGIYKTIGMTSSRIRLSLALGITAAATIGALLGAAGGVWLLPRVLETLLVQYGIVELPLVVRWGGIAAVSSIGILPAALGSWLSSRLIVRTSPRTLVVE